MMFKRSLRRRDCGSHNRSSGERTQPSGQNRLACQLLTTEATTLISKYDCHSLLDCDSGPLPGAGVLPLGLPRAATSLPHRWIRSGRQLGKPAGSLTPPPSAEAGNPPTCAKTLARKPCAGRCIPAVRPAQARPRSGFDRAGQAPNRRRNRRARYGGTADTGTAAGVGRQPGLGSRQGQVGHRSRQVRLEFRLGAPEVAELADSQLDQPRQPVAPPPPGAAGTRQMLHSAAGTGSAATVLSVDSSRGHAASDRTRRRDTPTENCVKNT